jgi:hypothetical protein
LICSYVGLVVAFWAFSLLLSWSFLHALYLSVLYLYFGLPRFLKTGGLDGNGSMTSGEGGKRRDRQLGAGGGIN